MKNVASRVLRRSGWLAALVTLTCTHSALAQLEVAGSLLINVDATGAAAGPLTAITNQGTLGGFFEARGGASARPVVGPPRLGATVGMMLDGGDYLQHVASVGGALIPADTTLVGAGATRSIEVWALNPAVADEETMVSWGRRGGPEGANLAFGYGNNGAYGAVGHWGNPDLGWNNAGGAPTANAWHHLVYTHDGTTTRVYADGVQLNSEVFALNTTAGTAVMIGAQYEADGVTVTPTLRGTLTIGRVRVHSEALSAVQVAANYNQEKPGFNDGTAPLPAETWRADTLVLNDGDTVGTWTSSGGRTANSAVGAPVFKQAVTPAGGPAVRFNQNRMGIATSPVAGATAFSIALVFKADAVGANANAQWYGKTGLIDAEQGGVTADWGTVITETGNVGLGIGAGDTSLYGTGASLVDGAYHVAVFTWGGGQQTVYVDTRPPVSAGSATAARNAAAFSFGGINTDEGAGARRFVGDFVEARFYGTALTSLEASNVIDELRTTHILGNLPRIFTFAASTNQIYLGQSVTLSWAVSNANAVVIDNGVGTVTPSNSIVLSPLATTTYTLSATNTNGLRTAQYTVAVNPGVPTAFNFATNTAYNTAVAMTLTGFDPQGSNLTYAIATPPAHGTILTPPPNVTYLPATNYGGLDSFTFTVSDGMFTSAPATVSLNIVPPALPPSGIALSTTNIPSGAGPGAFIAALQAIDVNNLYGDTHTFALVPGGADNGQFLLSSNILTASPTFVGGPGATFSVRLSATDSTSQSVTQDVVLVVFDAVRTVVINEIHYNPSYNPSRESFIELYNNTDAPVDLSNWRVRGGVDYFFPANTFLQPHTFIVVAEDPATVQTRFGVSAFGPWTGGLNNDGEKVTLRDALNDRVDEVDYKNEFPWPVAADGNGASAQLVHPSLDNDLGSSWRSALPTPGATNLVFTTNAAPNIRQVSHLPNWPKSTNQVTITAKVTDPDGVASVSLAFQVVTPGNYIPATLPLTGAQLNSLNTTPATNAPNPAFELPANWTTVPMHDDGVNGDAVAGDGVYSVLLPPQANRVLVRYRITCTDLLGATRRAPFEDDPSLNFAYYVYDGVPDYLGFSSASLQTLPVYFLITRDVDMNQCAAWYAPFNNGTDQLPQNVGGQRNQGRLHFNWEGAFVYDGKVFDHVTYRLRGANGRYFAGKRSFRIRFNDGALFQAEDNSGKKFPTKWREVVTGKGQSNRGAEQFALNELVSYFLWNKVGVPAPKTLYFHFRVVRGATEEGANQYSGDFWGLNWAQEKYDAAFLESHDLPKGNLYKLVDNFVDFADEQRYQGAFAPTNGADFYNLENNLDGFKSTDWLNAHANYTNWYRYFAIARGIRHYDTWPSANKNGAWYFEPLYGASNSFLGRMMQLPYDSTDTWGPTWNNGDDVLYNGIFATAATGGDAGNNPAMQLEYRNTVREIRSLLFQPDQMNSIIDGFANLAKPVASADLVRWSNAPAPANYMSLTYNTGPGITGGISGYAQDMKTFMFTGGNNAWWIDRTSVGAGGWVTVLDTESADAAIPTRPVITYIGSNGFPASGLAFQSSAFADPQGAGTFAAMQWRIAEVLPTNTVVTNPTQFRLEWDAAWTSPEVTSFISSLTFPEYAVEAGKTYRARVRHKDNTGRWSDWSLPVTFVPSPVDTVSLLRTNLVFNEIMYNPPPFGGIDGDELEFVELKNIGPFTLNLSGLFFAQGITFTFPDGTTLAPGAVFVLARNSLTMPFRYPGLVINGLYTDKLNNDGETLAIRHPVAGEIVSVTYGDRQPWPVTPDGFGFSLVRETDGTYRASAALYGNPGADGGASAVGGIVINELLSNSTLPLTDLIELQNIAATNVDISGWYLSDDAAFPQKFRIPSRAPLAPGEFAVFTENDFNPTPGLGTSFSLSSMGDSLYLFSADSGSLLTGYDTGVTFGAGGDGESFGRYINSVGEVQYPPQLAITPNATNTGPRVGPVVVTEIHYNPEPGGDEFVEIQNITGLPVALFDTANPTNTWRLNGVSFNFPTNVSLASNEIALVVATNPAAFRAKYSVPVSVNIYGPYLGNLQDSGENLELQRPEPPTTNGLPWVTVDAVRYNDKAPWPVAADGSGPSLQRLSSGGYGNDPINWIAATPNPGGNLLPGTPPAITTHPTNITVVVGGTATFAVNATGDAPLQFRWIAGGTNIPGATNATFQLTNVQAAQATNFAVVVFNGSGSVASSNAQLAVLSPVLITVHPTNQSVLPGTNVTLAVSASSGGAIQYQWRFEGVDIPGATNSSHTFVNANLEQHHGNFSVMVSDAISSATSSNAYVYVLVKPVVVQHVAGQTVPSGGNATFTCLATGAPPIYYRWLRAGSVVGINTNGSFTYSNNLVSTTVRVVVSNQAAATVYSPGPGSLVSVPLTVVACTDCDGDGMLDSWEVAYLGGTNASPTLDSDGDGMNNRDEYRSGTIPTNALSVLKMIFSTTNASELVFVAQTNLSYSVQWRTNLVSPTWTNLTSILASPQVRTIAVDSATAPAAGERYFRVVTPMVP